MQNTFFQPGQSFVNTNGKIPFGGQRLILTLYIFFFKIINRSIGIGTPRINPQTIFDAPVFPFLFSEYQVPRPRVPTSRLLGGGCRPKTVFYSRIDGDIARRNDQNLFIRFYCCKQPGNQRETALNSLVLPVVFYGHLPGMLFVLIGLADSGIDKSRPLVIILPG